MAGFETRPGVRGVASCSGSEGPLSSDKKQSEALNRVDTLKLYLRLRGLFSLPGVCARRLCKEKV